MRIWDNCLSVDDNLLKEWPLEASRWEHTHYRYIDEKKASAGSISRVYLFT